MRKYKISVKVVIGITISGIIIYLLLKNIPLDESMQYLRQWDLKIVLLATLISFIAILIRGVKFNIIFSLVKQISVIEAIHATNIGLMFNAVIPARPGDFLKAIYIKRKKKYSMSIILSVITYDRLLDVMVLYGMFIISFIILRDEIGDTYINNTLITKQILIGFYDILLIALLTVVIILILINIRKFRKFIVYIYKNNEINFFRSILKFILGFIWATNKIVRTSLNSNFILKICIFSILPWFLFSLSVYIISIGGPIEKISFIKAMFVASLSLSAVQLPSMPGGWGLFEAGVIIAMVSTTNIQASIIVPFAFIIHLTQYIPVILLGLLSKSSLLISKPSYLNN